MRSLRKILLFAAILCTTSTFCLCNTNYGKKKSAVVTGISDQKEFKKLLQSKNNVLALFVVDREASTAMMDIFRDAAEATRGQATVVIVECHSKDGKRLCKSLKVGEDQNYYMKHFKDGKFHKDYDRKTNLKSIITFLKDPTGDLPWDEDESATDVLHLPHQAALMKLLKKNPAGLKKTLVLFYAPWCGYCKTLKPEYVKAAKDLKDEATLAAMDVARPENAQIRSRYNITAFPTLIYFYDGILKFPYSGPTTHKDLVKFMQDPTLPVVTEKSPTEESWSADSDIVHLNDQNFDEITQKHNNALVVFYTTWCGHCKKIKPQFEKAAAVLKKTGVEGILGAVDATKNPKLTKQFNIAGYPTIKFFKQGVFEFDASHLREESKIVKFMENPQEPPPPPPPEAAWSDEESAVKHLTADNFRSVLRKVKHALVMFYAPWCGHCKNAKPEVVKAADKFNLELRVLFAAVDCTSENVLCKKYNVTGFPTFKYFSHLDKMVTEYDGGRTEKDFVNFMHRRLGSGEGPKSANPEDFGFTSDVAILTDDSFEAAIAAKKPTFVMFFATWCVNCAEVKPSMNKLAERMKSKGIVNVAAVDVGTYLTVADLTGVSTMPTFKLFSSGRLVADYEGDRSAEDMLKFVTSRASPEKNEL